MLLQFLKNNLLLCIGYDKRLWHSFWDKNCQGVDPESVEWEVGGGGSRLGLNTCLIK